MGGICIIYAAITVLLAWVDALRIKAKLPKVENIDHKVSWQLATWSAVITLVIYYWDISFSWWFLLASLIIAVAFVFIRLALFDPLLNIFRLWTGTNPTGRIDYVSTTTSSYEDQHSEKVGFWAKRAMGVAGWLVMFLLYKVIFRV